MFDFLFDLVSRLQSVKAEKNLLVFGHTNIDHIFSVQFLPEKNQTTEVFEHKVLFGGTGANLALQAASLGLKVYLSSYVGGDFPEKFRNKLKKAGVQLDYFFVRKEAITPTCWIYNDRKQNQMIFIEQGAMKEMENYPLPEIHLNNFDFVHVGTGRPIYYLRLFESWKREWNKSEEKPVLAFDPGQEMHYVYTKERFSAMMKYVDIFFGNREEWKISLNYLGFSEASYINKISSLAIRTLGKEGAEIFCEGKRLFIPSVKVFKKRDTTGAGDAFRAGFYAALLRGASVEEAGWFASLTASFFLWKKNGEEHLPTFERLRRFLEMAKD